MATRRTDNDNPRPRQRTSSSTRSARSAENERQRERSSRQRTTETGRSTEGRHVASTRGSSETRHPTARRVTSEDRQSRRTTSEDRQSRRTTSDARQPRRTSSDTRQARRAASDTRQARPSRRTQTASVAQASGQGAGQAEGVFDPRVAGWQRIGVLAVMGVMTLGCILGLLFFLRPTISEFENRTLTSYPEFALGEFVDGTYTSQVSLWYADTYPIREPLVRANFAIKNLYGVQPETQLIGGNRTSDALPPEGERTTEPQREHSHDVSEPDVRIRAAEIEDQIVDGLYVDATTGSAYTLYYFDQDATERYADVINDAAKLLEGKADVYSVLLPTNAGVMLSDETLAKLGVPNQEQAIDYFYSLMNDNVYTANTFDKLYEHRDEYLYFHSDHHWTQLAAFYAYTAFCETKGIEPPPYDEWEELIFKPFYGEYDPYVIGIELTEDYVSARIPQGTNEMEYWVDDLDDSSKTEGPVISDLTNDDPDSNKYNCFVCGNRPLSHIHNPNVTDGSSCLVIKDSFGNPFVSVMVDSYEDIYTIDFRFTNQKLVDLVERYGIKDVIFENVLMFAGTYDASELLSSIVYPSENTDAAGKEDAGEAADENDEWIENDAGANEVEGEEYDA